MDSIYQMHLNVVSEKINSHSLVIWFQIQNNLIWEINCFLKYYVKQTNKQYMFYPSCCLGTCSIHCLAIPYMKLCLNLMTVQREEVIVPLTQGVNKIETFEHKRNCCKYCGKVTIHRIQEGVPNVAISYIMKKEKQCNLL